MLIPTRGGYMIGRRDNSRRSTVSDSRAPVRVALVNPSPMARAGLKACLESVGTFTIVAEAPTCDELLLGLSDARPRLLIADVGDRPLSSLAAARLAAPGVRILVLASSPARVAEAAQAGADGFLLNDADGEQISASIDQLLAGHAVLDPELAIDALRSAQEPVGEPEPLTSRELEVLRLMSQGNTNPQIARRLFLAVGTVKVHVEHILAKLAAVDRTDAAVRALNRGLLDDDPGMNERHMPIGRS
jgi:NarL family two-component system response regulator LiaR